MGLICNSRQFRCLIKLVKKIDYTFARPRQGMVSNYICAESMRICLDVGYGLQQHRFDLVRGYWF